MKQQLTVIAAIALFIISIAPAQVTHQKFTTDDQKITFATRNLLNGIQSDNPGVIEASMRIAAQMKLRFSHADVAALTGAINKIRRTHPSGSLRYKAYVAAVVCEQPELFRDAESVNSAKDDEFYRAASTHMQQQLLSVNAE